MRNNVRRGDNRGTVRIARVTLAAIFMTAVEFLLLLVLSRVEVPLPSLVILAVGTVVGLVVSWYLGSQGLNFAWVLLAFYLARVLGVLPGALLLQAPVLATLVSGLTLSAYSPVTGPNLPSAAFTVLWTLVVAGIGFAFGVRRRVNAPAEPAHPADAP
jgi:hypothetical protein